MQGPVRTAPTRPVLGKLGDSAGLVNSVWDVHVFVKHINQCNFVNFKMTKVGIEPQHYCLFLKGATTAPMVPIVHSFIYILYLSNFNINKNAHSNILVMIIILFLSNKSTSHAIIFFINI